MAQTFLPNATISGQWVSMGAATQEAALIDDSDVSYIGPTGNGLQETVIGLSPGNDPHKSTGHVIRARASSTIASGPPEIAVDLYQGAVLIAAAVFDLDGTPTDYTYTLSAPEADAITNYEALRLRFAATTVKGENAKVYKASFETSDAPGDILLTGVS